ncbi:MAG: hypothetical protein RR087_11800 [Oscillospiraceae bacterium]
MEEKYKVYIKTDAQGRVVEINSSAFIQDSTKWLQIAEGSGDRYHHAQRNYLEKNIVNADGTHAYIYENKIVRETTIAEQGAERASFPKPSPSIDERLAAAESAVLALMGVQNV